MPKLDQYRIVIGKDASYNERATAKFLANNISAATGYQPEVVTDETASAPYEIVVGKTDRERTEGVSFERERDDAKEYEFELRFVDTRLFLTGFGEVGEKIITPFNAYATFSDGAVGTSLAAYRFVEMTFGAGFLFPADLSSMLDLDASQIEIGERYNYLYTKKALFDEKPAKIKGAALYSIPVMGTNRRFGNCFVFKSADGSFTVYNGGFERDAEHLCDVLDALNEGNGKPHVTAWLVSLPMFGYTGALKEISANESLSNRLAVDKICCKLLSENFYTAGSASCKKEYAEYRNAIYDAAKAFGCEVCEVSTGDVIKSGDFDIDVVWAPASEVESAPKVHINDSSVVYKVSFAGQRIMLFGNARKCASDYLAAKGREVLACDVMQVSYHGREGVSRACLEAAGAKKYIYQSNPALYYGDNGEGFASDGGSISRTRNHLSELGATPKDICKDTYGILSFALPIELN